MKINPKVTGALAWTGLVLVLAVPAADMLGGKPEAKATLTSDMDQVKVADQVKTASVKPVVPQPVKTDTAAAPALTGDPVADFKKSGRKMPSYISGNDSPVVEASTPAAPVKKPGTVTVNPDGTIDRPVTTLPATVQEPEIASIKPDLVAPVPLPASARAKQSSRFPISRSRPTNAVSPRSASTSSRVRATRGATTSQAGTGSLLPLSGSAPSGSVSK